MVSLFDPIRLGSIEAANRIFMAPMTRGRATRDHVPTPLMARYYGQRASAGLILTEAIGISLQGLAWPYAPGIWNGEQVEAWRAVTDAVHEAGGRIVAQLWHMGRLTHSNFAGRGRPISASATTAPGLAQTYEGKLPYEEARAVDIAEIPVLIEQFSNAARNAIRAGFDGVQIHAANGYLLDQFLRSSSNLRHDKYGGGPENRIRLLEEVTVAIAHASVRTGRLYVFLRMVKSRASTTTIRRNSSLPQPKRSPPLVSPFWKFASRASRVQTARPTGCQLHRACARHSAAPWCSTPITTRTRDRRCWMSERRTQFPSGGRSLQIPIFPVGSQGARPFHNPTRHPGTQQELRVTRNPDLERPLE